MNTYMQMVFAGIGFTLFLSSCASQNGSTGSTTQPPSSSDRSRSIEACRESFSLTTQGMMYVRMNSTKNAEMEFQKAIEICPANAKAHLNLGVIELNKSDYGPAETHFRDAISNSEKNLSYSEEFKKSLEATRTQIASTNETAFSGSKLLLIGGLGAATSAKNKDQLIAGLASMGASLPLMLYEQNKENVEKIKIAEINFQIDTALKEIETAKKDVAIIIPLAHYNLASLYSIQENTGESLTEIEQALLTGKNVITKQNLENDPDLTKVRKLPEFKALLVKHSVFK